jgi:FkbM family methyltransferase
MSAGVAVDLMRNGASLLEGNPLMARFVSYAQNYEDVILWRALQHIENGFYVDCGAYDPDRDSVTMAFYERGWRGINIEPLPHLLQKFVTQRPRDINLSVALSDNSDGTRFYEVADTGLSTLLPDLAGRHVNAGFIVRQTEVPTRKLSDVLAEYLPAAIHFMKIDVEGAESLVLRGADFERFRPWVILIEATLPRSSEPSAD